MVSCAAEYTDEVCVSYRMITIPLHPFPPVVYQPAHPPPHQVLAVQSVHTHGLPLHPIPHQYEAVHQVE